MAARRFWMYPKGTCADYTSADVEAHLVVVSRRIRGCTVQTLIDGLRADQNALLSRRAYLLHPEAA